MGDFELSFEVVVFCCYENKQIVLNEFFLALRPLGFRIRIAKAENPKCEEKPIFLKEDNQRF